MTRILHLTARAGAWSDWQDISMLALGHGVGNVWVFFFCQALHEIFCSCSRHSETRQTHMETNLGILSTFLLLNFNSGTGSSKIKHNAFQMSHLMNNFQVTFPLNTNMEGMSRYSSWRNYCEGYGAKIWKFTFEYGKTWAHFICFKTAYSSVWVVQVSKNTEVLTVTTDYEQQK